MKQTVIAADAPCPCGMPQALSLCCGRYHRGTPAPTAEALMRSRYSAYVCRDRDYLLNTWHPSTRPADLNFEPGIRWLGLRIVESHNIGSTRAEVEFVARSRVGGGAATRMRERSHFVQEQGRWFYLDGDIA